MNELRGDSAVTSRRTDPRQAECEHPGRLNQKRAGAHRRVADPEREQFTFRRGRVRCRSIDDRLHERLQRRLGEVGRDLDWCVVRAAPLATAGRRFKNEVAGAQLPQHLEVGRHAGLKHSRLPVDIGEDPVSAHKVRFQLKQALVDRAELVDAKVEKTPASAPLSCDRDRAQRPRPRRIRDHGSVQGRSAGGIEEFPTDWIEAESASVRWRSFPEQLE